MSAAASTSTLQRESFADSNVATGKRSATSKKERQHAAMSRLQKALEAIGHWAIDHSAKIKDVVAVLKNRQFEVFVVTKSAEYDFELSKVLTEFTSPYVLRGIIGNATLVPMADDGELRCYFDPRQVLLLRIPSKASAGSVHAFGD